MSCDERQRLSNAFTTESNTPNLPNLQQVPASLEHHKQSDQRNISYNLTNTASIPKFQPDQSQTDMAMHNFGPNPLQHEHQQQLKNQQQPINEGDQSRHNSSGDILNSDAKLSAVSNKSNNNLGQKSFNEHHSPIAVSNMGLNRHQQQQQQQLQPQYGIFSPQIPTSLQSSFESRVDQIIRTTLHDSPAYTPPTSKNGNSNNSSSGLSASSGNTLSPSSSSSLIYNPAPGMMNTPASSASLNIHSHPPNSSNNSNQTLSPPRNSVTGLPLTAINDMSGSGPKGNFPAKTSAHSSASHSALAAAAALQSLNQSHMQRSQQQLAHTQHAPFSSATPLTTKTPLNSSGTLTPQAAHGGSNSQLSKLFPISTSLPEKHPSHIVVSNGHQDSASDLALRSQSSELGHNNDMNSKVHLQTSTLNAPPTSWQEHSNQANGIMSRFLSSHGLNPLHALPTPQSPHELNNSNIGIGINLNSGLSSIGSDGDNSSRSNSLKNLPGQYNPSQLHEEKIFTSNCLDVTKHNQRPFDASRGLHLGNINDINLRAHPGSVSERVPEERLAIFSYNLFSNCAPGKNGYKTVIHPTPEIMNSIRDGKFYTNFHQLAAGILMNNIIIPSFSIIDYLRKDRFSQQEMEKIEQVNRQLSYQDLLCLMELVKQRPPARSSSRLASSAGFSFPNTASSLTGMNYHQDLGNSTSAHGSHPLISSSPNRLELSGNSSIDKSRRSSQSPSDIYRSHLGGNGNNLKIISAQTSIPSTLQNSSHQYIQIPYNNSQNKPPFQHTSPQGNRSSPFQPPFMVGQQSIARPPRSQSTLGDMNMGNFSSPMSTMTFQPPAAHQNSSRPNLSALNRDNVSTHPYSSGAPIAAHLSSKTPQTPRLFPPPLSSTPSGSLSLSSGSPPNKIMTSRDLTNSSQSGGYPYLPQVKPNDSIMSAYKQQQILLSNKLIDNGPGALHQTHPVTNHGLGINNGINQRSLQDESLSTDQQTQNQTNYSKNTSQRSIITGTAQAGPKKGKKSKTSPTATPQQVESKVTHRASNEINDINKSVSSVHHSAETQNQNNTCVPTGSCNHAPSTELTLPDTQGSVLSAPTTVALAVPSSDSTNPVTARGLDNDTPKLQSNIGNITGQMVDDPSAQGSPIETCGHDEREVPAAPGTIIDNEPNLEKSGGTCLQENFELHEPSKYHKLYTKKAWLKNYTAEDQTSSEQIEQKTTPQEINQIKPDIEEKQKSVVDNSVQSKTNGSAKVTKSRKRAREDKVTKSSSIPPAKATRTTTKTDNDSEETTASTSEADDTDETDSMKSATDQKLRRMPRRKVKTNSDREANDQQLSTKSKVSRDRDSSRKRIRGEKITDQSNISKRKSDDESLKQQAKKSKNTDSKVTDNKSPKGKKRTGEKFLQTQPCYEIVPKNIRCLECRRVRQSSLKNDKNGQTKQASKTNWDDFCRFFEFRKLRYNKAGKIVVAGFLESIDAKESERKLWKSECGNKELDKLHNITTNSAKFILSNIGHEFCKLVLQERTVELSWHQNNHNRSTTWKRTVNGLRELCDVCSTTLFNCQFVCERCGFVVCIDCCHSRSETDKIKVENSSSEKGDSNDTTGNSENDQSSMALKKGKKDSFGWSLCAKNEEHCHDKLTLATIIPPFCLEDLWTRYHDIIRRLSLNPCENCKPTGLQNHTDLETGAVKVKLEVDRENPQSSLKDLLFANPNSGEEEKNDKQSNQLITRDLDFGHEDDSQDDSRQVSAAIEGCIASLNIEGQYNGDCKAEDKSKERTNFRLCDGDLLVLEHSHEKKNRKIFQEHWKQGKPVLVRGIHNHMNIDMWLPQFFLSKFGEYRSDLVDCRNGDIHRQSMRKYWDGFEPNSNKKPRCREESIPTHIPTTHNEEPSAVSTCYYSGSALWRLKDWPPGQDFKEILPEHYEDFMNNLPLRSYTTRTGKLNLACRLPEEMVSPDLGPKMYSAYGTTKFPERGTTNLHLDISDAINVMVYVAGASQYRQGSTEYSEIFDKTVDECHVEPAMKAEIKKRNLIPGALWHLFRPSDAPKMRDFLNKVSDERKISLEKRVDPIHDQVWYLDQTLLDRLFQEYGVKAYPILQCMGDAILVPAGAPHQVKNLQNCIKVANDFVSPENIKYCLQLTNEFRKLPETHINQQDKLQIKNIIYYSMKDSVLVTDMNLEKQKTIATDDDEDGEQTDEGKAD